MQTTSKWFQILTAADRRATFDRNTIYLEVFCTHIKVHPSHRHITSAGIGVSMTEDALTVCLSRINRLHSIQPMMCIIGDVFLSQICWLVMHWRVQTDVPLYHNVIMVTLTCFIFVLFRMDVSPCKVISFGSSITHLLLDVLTWGKGNVKYGNIVLMCVHL